MTISEPHAPIFDQIEALEQRGDEAVQAIVRRSAKDAATIPLTYDRPLMVYRESPKRTVSIFGDAWMLPRWFYYCRLCNWEDPRPSRAQAIAFHCAEMHYDTVHAGPFNRSAA